MIDVKVEVQKVVYYSDDTGFGIISGRIIQILSGKDEVRIDQVITIKGNMVRPIDYHLYRVQASDVLDARYGKQYNISSITEIIDGNNSDKYAQKQFLSALFTAKQVEAMYSDTKNPFKALVDKDVETLIKIKGVRFKTASAWIRKVEENLDRYAIYTEIPEYHLTNLQISKGIEKYGSADNFIQMIKKNPYELTKIPGMGFKTVDKIAMQGGIQPFSIDRVEAYIVYILRECGQDGSSYEAAQAVFDSIIEYFGDEISDQVIVDALQHLHHQEILWWDDNKQFLGLQKYYALENAIADEIVRIMKSTPKKYPIDWRELLKEKEKEQGWEYTEQQIHGIEMALNNNFVCIAGYGGTGKTSIVDGLLYIMKGLKAATCALAGKAAARIADITGEESYTIHRLLGWEGRDFKYNSQNPLELDLVIVDEISMIGGSLFLSLLRAIKSGTKIILLGDDGQLESIGECKVGSDLIRSGLVPSIFLTQIHRQAAKSGIITESINVRHGIQITPKDYAGTDIRGELHDLVIDSFSDASNTYYKTLQHFSREYEDIQDIMEVQVITALREKGAASAKIINDAIQSMYNPTEPGKPEIVLSGKTIRLGDKVINRKNQYRVENIYGKICPVYNGNMGIVKEIRKETKEAVIDFVNVGTIVMGYAELQTVELGYAITCHSSQGSQFERVIVSMDYSAYVLLSREFVYTAITRASKKCILAVQNSALRYAIGHEGTSEKNTHLPQLLYEKIHPEKIKLGF